MPRSGKNLITALDIGSSKTSCFIAEMLPDNTMNIMGIGHHVSGGIKAGSIINLKLAEHSIRSAVGAAEQMAGVNVDKAVVSISGCGQKSHYIQTSISISGHEISARDIHRIISQGCAQLQSDDIEIIHCLPVEYTIDNLKGIKDPQGMRGRILGARMHIITASSGALLNINTCLANCHLDVEDYISSPYASAIACLNEDEKLLGSILLDFGGGDTSLVIFKNGNMIYTDFIPVGGIHITNDIAVGITTSLETAERVKTLYGNLISTARDEREIIDVQQIGDDGKAEMSHVQKSTLVSIIKPRVDEIVELIAESIDASGYGSMGGNIVITGGGSQIVGLKEMIAYSFSKQVRQGLPMRIEGMAESTKGAAFSTCTGMLLFTLQKRRRSSYDFMGRIARFNNPLNRLVSWLRENF